MPADKLPHGARLFVDAGVLYGWSIGVPGLRDLAEACTGLMERVERRELAALTSTSALADAMHKVAVTQAAVVHGLVRANLVPYLRRHRALLRSLTAHSMLAHRAMAIGIEIHEVAVADVLRAPELSRRHGLLMNDALILAVMERLRIHWLATNDDDFDSVSGINVWKPRPAQGTS